MRTRNTGRLYIKHKPTDKPRIALASKIITGKPEGWACYDKDGYFGMGKTPELAYLAWKNVPWHNADMH